MGSFDLHSYREQFERACLREFGKPYNFSAFEKEKAFQALREGKNRRLSARDISLLFDERNTPFKLYWPKPNEKDLEKALKTHTMSLGPEPIDPKDLVKQLLSVFHDIGVVSLILRFVHPGTFGIISTPLINLLQIHRSKTLDLYLEYCKELAAWQKHFRMASVAETEMALWTFYKISGVGAEAQYAEKARAAFDSDIWIQQRRTAQAVTPFLKKYEGEGALELSRILAAEHPKLAAMIAGVEFERLLRCAAARNYVQSRPKDNPLIEQLKREGVISAERAFDLQEVWRWRNQAVHPDEPPTPIQVEVMIDRIRQNCYNWDKRSKVGS